MKQVGYRKVRNICIEDILRQECDVIILLVEQKTIQEANRTMKLIVLNL